MFKVDLGVARL